MEKEQSRINGLGHGSFFLESLEQKLLKPRPASRRDSINRALAAARNLLPPFRRDIPRSDQLPHSIIKGADVDVGVALDQSVIEPPFDFIGVQVTAMKGAEDKKFRFHIKIVISQLNYMKAMSSAHSQPNSSSSAHSTFKTIGAVVAALGMWIFVATVLNLPLRTSWPHYHEAEIAFNFTLTMKLARLALGAISSVAAGFVAAWIGNRRIRAATVTGVILLGLFIPNHYLLWSKFPVWYHLTFLVSLVPFTLLGAALYQILKIHDGELTGD
jgi:hypothetical protein